VRTPPLDGRILPGTARLAVLDLLDELGLPARVAPVTLAELAAADGAFLTNAIRGVQWVRAVAGEVAWDKPCQASADIAFHWSYGIAQS
jgi:para-aminobenzoate synthetase / 4-amino-4-deoxychorismate lyase